MINKNIIFVYGTLRKGQLNHFYLRNAHYIGKGKTVEKYGFFITQTGIPFATCGSEYPVSIVGEVYAVDDITLREIDHLEGHPFLYLREKVEIILETGEPTLAWMYFFLNNGFITLKQPIQSGDFLRVSRSPEAQPLEVLETKEVIL